MAKRQALRLMQCGRRISSEQIDRICETVELFPPLSLSEPATTNCEHLGWYTAAGWRLLGMTTGQGLVGEGCSYTTSAKKIFVRPLAEDFRSVLCSEPPAGEAVE